MLLWRSLVSAFLGDMEGHETLYARWCQERPPDLTGLTSLGKDTLWLQAVGGNTALALLLTVGTNLAGIFTMPFMLCWLLDTGNSAVALSPGPLLQSLVKTILVPLLIGAGARAFIPGQQRSLDADQSCSHACWISVIKCL